MTLRRIAALIRQLMLDRGSALNRALSDYPDWTSLHELVATGVDWSTALGWPANPAAPKGNAPWRPAPRIPRPWDPPEEEKSPLSKIEEFRRNRAKRRGGGVT